MQQLLLRHCYRQLHVAFIFQVYSALLAAEEKNRVRAEEISSALRSAERAEAEIGVLKHAVQCASEERDAFQLKIAQLTKAAEVLRAAASAQRAPQPVQREPLECAECRRKTLAMQQYSIDSAEQSARMKALTAESESRLAELSQLRDNHHSLRNEMRELQQRAHYAFAERERLEHESTSAAERAAELQARVDRLTRALRDGEAQRQQPPPAAAHDPPVRAEASKRTETKAHGVLARAQRSGLAPQSDRLTDA